MTKAELVSAIAEKSGLTKGQAREALEAFTTSVTDCLKNGEEVRLVGFGSFMPVTRPAGMARNPRTGAHVPVDQKSVPFFKTGKEMRERLNRNSAASTSETSKPSPTSTPTPTP